MLIKKKSKIMFHIHILGYSTQFSVIFYRVEIYEREKKFKFSAGVWHPKIKRVGFNFD